MNYTKVSFELNPVLPAREILYVELGNLEFESFEETSKGLDAYIPSKYFDKKILDKLIVLDIPNQKINIKTETIEQQNWNAVWESNFPLIHINNKCTIRAPFHNSTNVQYDVIISPQMSFGTGHHETTYLMANELFKIDIKDKTLLDMGCGTGVLAIISSKLGACKIEAIDIEEWAYRNTKENTKLNDISDIKVLKGDSSLLHNKKYDIILANINRNILLKDMKTYSNSLNINGKILFSGFYETDVPVIKEEAEENGLVFEKTETKNNWAMSVFNKK